MKGQLGLYFGGISLFTTLYFDTGQLEKHEQIHNNKQEILPVAINWFTQEV